MRPHAHPLPARAQPNLKVLLGFWLPFAYLLLAALTCETRRREDSAGMRRCVRARASLPGGALSAAPPLATARASRAAPLAVPLIVIYAIGITIVYPTWVAMHAGRVSDRYSPLCVPCALRLAAAARARAPRRHRRRASSRPPPPPAATAGAKRRGA